MRFLNWEGLGDTEDAVKAMHYAILMKADVINVAFSAEGYDDGLYRAFRSALDHDIVVVAAASNDGEDLDKTDTYPAKFRLPNQITVAASDKADHLWKHSNWGLESVHVAVPAVDVLGPWKGSWETGSGTSDAAAIASGVVGLVRSANRRLSASQVVEILTKTARKSDALYRKTISGGALDALAAVRCATDPRLSCLR